ncbi:MAG TPA: peptidoglycan-binding protein [Candidatus Excrementavichristensenella intestinipullorum]|nr:peptidoglycan-binding protein [Candidatus Excrementavichristensenella intestinipullorum]
MHGLIRRAMGLALAMLMLLGAAQAQTLYTVQAAKLYKKNSVTAKIVADLEAGEAVRLIAAKGKWAKVKYEGKTGFVKKALLKSQAPADQDPAGEDQGSTLYAQAQLKLYKAKRLSAKVMAKIPQGAQVLLLEQGSKWGKVRYGNKTGYVLAAKLGQQPPQEDAPQEDAPQEDAPQEEQYATLEPGDTGEAVKKLQRRLKALEWFSGEIGGNYKTLTTQAVKDFQKAAGLPQTGIADSATQAALYAQNAPDNKLDNRGETAPGKSKEMDWWTSGIQEIFARGKTATVTDVVTGLSWQVVRSGGTNHADVQPKTAQDTALMKKAYGGTWSWNRRAIWVSIGGEKYAASMNGMPHGSDSIKDNDFDGHHCIHFTNSRTHGTNVVCALHQAAIRKALAAG